ncbi:MAG TPA: VOC family protein, partial [Bryobacteraceae bacterium]|nr:VOC family protein [Bryobacteraceae bacterium]
MRYFLLIVVAAFQSTGQVLTPGGSGVSMGHLHFTVLDPAVHQRFWVATFGVPTLQLGDNLGVKLPGAILLFKAGNPSGGSVGSIVNHVGVLVPNLIDAVAKCKTNGGTIESQNALQSMVMLPDGIKLELTQDAALKTSVANHHIHFYDADVEETRAWYVKMFGAKPGRRGQFQAADLPGVNLTFSKSETAAAPSKGRAVDHIGFEVRDLEAFCKRLEAMGVKLDQPFHKLPKLKLSLAFLTDPWGT